MPENQRLEQVQTEKPIDGYGALTLRMKVDGGYLYNVIIMDVAIGGALGFRTQLLLCLIQSELEIGNADKTLRPRKSRS
jgi:hypothetical protein